MTIPNLRPLGTDICKKLCILDALVPYKKLSTAFFTQWTETFTFCIVILLNVGHTRREENYRARKKGLYVVARNFFLILLNFSAWTCLAVA